MHDYHKALEMVAFAKEKANGLGKDKITKITVAIGESSGYSPESVCMYFKDVSKGTVCENAEVEIRSVPSMLECPSCKEVFPRKLMRYDCPKCGEEGVPSMIGSEVTIESVETGETK